VRKRFSLSIISSSHLSLPQSDQESLCFKEQSTLVMDASLQLNSNSDSKISQSESKGFDLFSCQTIGRSKQSSRKTIHFPNQIRTNK
jgi:hypothetical protein